MLVRLSQCVWYRRAGEDSVRPVAHPAACDPDADQLRECGIPRLRHAPILARPTRLRRVNPYVGLETRPGLGWCRAASCHPYVGWLVGQCDQSSLTMRSGHTDPDLVRNSENTGAWNSYRSCACESRTYLCCLGPFSTLVLPSMRCTAFGHQRSRIQTECPKKVFPTAFLKYFTA